MALAATLDDAMVLRGLGDGKAEQRFVVDRSISSYESSKNVEEMRGEMGGSRSRSGGLSSFTLGFPVQEKSDVVRHGSNSWPNP